MDSAVSDTQFPAVCPHGQLEELFPDVFFVMGSVKMAGPLPVRFSRNMTVIRQGEALTLVNSMRLDDAGLAALDQLGKVEHVIRIAGFHGMDDPFYKHRYGAKVWAVKGHVYAKGFKAVETKPADGYFHPDVEMDAGTELPIADATLIPFTCRGGESLLRLDREGGILISGYALQNWSEADRYFNWVAAVMMRLMGFIKPHNVGPGWLEMAEPKREEIAALLDLDFQHVLPVHGAPVIGGAKEKYRPSIEKAARART